MWFARNHNYCISVCYVHAFPAVFDGNRGDFAREVEDIIFLPDATIACTMIDIKNDPYFEAEIETFSVAVDYFDSLVSFTTSTADILIRDNDGENII